MEELGSSGVRAAPDQCEGRHHRCSREFRYSSGYFAWFSVRAEIKIVAPMQSFHFLYFVHQYDRTYTQGKL